MDVMTTKIMVLAVVGLIISCTLYGELRRGRRALRAPRHSNTVWRRDDAPGHVPARNEPVGYGFDQLRIAEQDTDEFDTTGLEGAYG